MKIAVIRSECSYAKGGAERYAANLCRTLAGMGHEVWVLAEKFDNKIHPALIHIPIKVDRTTSSTRNTSFHRNAQKALGDLDPDAVLALSRSYPADAFRVSDPLHRFWMNIRYPGKAHRFLQSLNPRHRTILNLERQIFDPANTRMIITNSKLSKRIIGDFYRYPDQRVHVVYNGVDHQQFSPAVKIPATHGAVTLLFVGQDFKRKGLSPLINALEIVKRGGFNISLKVIGKDDPAPYQAEAEKLGVSQLVAFEGPTPHLQDAYRAADLFVFPTLYDPFANVCLEALACGLPVLTTATNGASEIISEEQDGYVVPGEPARLSACLANRIMRFSRLDDAKRSAMSDAAHTKAKAFTIEANATAIAGLLGGKGETL